VNELEIIRKLAEIIGWTDFIARRSKYRPGWLAKRPGSGKGIRREAVYLGLQETMVFIIRGGHVLAIDGRLISVRLADGRSATAEVDERRLQSWGGWVVVLQSVVVRAFEPRISIEAAQ
jgi:hypothetical protein